MSKIDYSKLGPPETSFALRGVIVTIKNAPYGLVRKLMSAAGTIEQADASADIIRACCSIDGEAIDPDQLGAVDIATLSGEAIHSNREKAPDFTKPPAVSDSGGMV